MFEFVCKVNNEAQERLWKRSSKLNALFPIIFGILGFAFLLLFFILTSAEVDIGPYLIIPAILLIGLSILIPVIINLSRRTAKKNSALLSEDTIMDMIFDEDKITIISSKGEDYKATIETKYECYFNRIEETLDAYFMWVNLSSCHVVLKKNIVKGTIEDFSAFLKGKYLNKYIVKK